MDEDHGHDSDSTASLPDPRSFLETLVSPVTRVEQRHESELLKIAGERDDAKFQRAYDDFKQLVEVCDPKAWGEYQNRHEIFRTLAMHGRIEALKFLLQPAMQANVNDQDKEKGQTALHRAALRSQFQTVQLLIDNGADVHLRSHQSSGGETPLHSSLKWSKERKVADTKKTVALLLKHGADPNRKSKGQNEHYTPLYCAANKGHDQVVPLLLEYGADPSAKSHGRVLPLHRAAYMGHDKVVAELLKYDQARQVNEPDRAGHTPLYFAVHNYEEIEGKSSLSGNYPQTVKELLGWDADVRRKVRGLSMTDWAESFGAGSEIARLIQHKTRKYHFRSFIDHENEVRLRLKPPSSFVTKEACSRTNASVFHFSSQDGSKLAMAPFQTSIAELIYSDGIRKEIARIESPEQIEFKWYHLPANNVSFPIVVGFELKKVYYNSLNG